MDVHELAAATGLHVTTVRFHLDVLARSDKITAHKAPRATPGRPRSVYTIRAEEVRPDGYQTLAALLAAHFGSTPSVRRRRAEQAGRDWADNLIPAAEHVGDIDDAARRVTDLFVQLDFDPELVDAGPAGDEREIRLRACPYLTVAADHPDVVCAIHLGLLQGALSRLGQASTTARMVPLVEPHLCLAYLTPEPPQAPSRPGVSAPD